MAASDLALAPSSPKTIQRREAMAYRVELVLCGVEVLACLDDNGQDAECDGRNQHWQRLVGGEDCMETERPLSASRVLTKSAHKPCSAAPVCTSVLS